MHAALIAKSIEFYQDEVSEVGFVTAFVDSIDKRDKDFHTTATRGPSPEKTHSDWSAFRNF
jgi:hypothetical protein